MIKIVYSYPSASGNEVRHIIEASTFDEAEEICQHIEALPDYRIEDVWQDIDLD